MPTPIMFLILIAHAGFFLSLGWLAGMCNCAEMLRKAQCAAREANIKALEAEDNARFFAEQAERTEKLLSAKTSLLVPSLIDIKPTRISM